MSPSTGSDSPWGEEGYCSACRFIVPAENGILLTHQRGVASSNEWTPPTTCAGSLSPALVPPTENQDDAFQSEPQHGTCPVCSGHVRLIPGMVGRGGYPTTVDRHRAYNQRYGHCEGSYRAPMEAAADD